jgi:hypothetical protein
MIHCHVERSETSLTTAFELLGRKWPEIPRFAQNDRVAYFFSGIAVIRG